MFLASFLLGIASPPRGCVWWRREKLRLIFEDDVQGVDHAGNPSEQSQRNVDEEVGAATTLKEDTQRGDEEGDNDLADIGSGERHFGGSLSGCLMFRELGVVW
jgi:hypothetical protein